MSEPNDSERLVNAFGRAISLTWRGAPVFEAKAALLAHIDALRAERDKWYGLAEGEIYDSHCACEFHRELSIDRRPIRECGYHMALRAEIATLRLDAERYRWLLASNRWLGMNIGNTANELTSYIDRAIREGDAK